MTDIEEKIEALATAIDESWRKNGAMNCTEVCAFVRTLKTTLKPAAEPVAWMDDGSTRSGSETTSFRVVSAETKSAMPKVSAGNFTTPLYAAPPAPPVAVKDLEWKDIEAYSATGHYRIQRLDAKWEPLHNGYYMLPRRYGVVKAFDTQDEAKAHCQKHHEARIRSALSAQVQDVAEGRYRHKKRGSTYTVIARARLQVDGDLDNEKVVVYRGDDGQMWVRPEYEFNDGRFEPLPAAPAKQDDKEPPICGTISAHEDSYDAS